MPSDCISYQDSGFFSTLITDYLNRDSKVRALYHRFPTMEGFEAQIAEKKSAFPQKHRDLLKQTLEQQYQNVETSASTRFNIDALAHENTFTVVTGHQLNLFTGPLYFVHKIVTAIALARDLSAQYPDYTVVPVYWMATEDHDFEEISHFELFGKKIQWKRESHGPVGRLSTEGLSEIYDAFAALLPPSDQARELKTLFQKAYLEHHNLTDATRFLANALFAEYGLVILDADNRELKQLFVPQMQNELLHQTAFEKINETTAQMGAYGIQVNPREINLFYMQDRFRERIIADDHEFYVNNTTLRFSEAELLQQLRDTPEAFSPNVVLRPLYQEVILPNLCYIGGGGEIAYWLELKSLFDQTQTVFPILLVRNSVVYATQKQMQKAGALELSWSDLFLKNDVLQREYTKRISPIPLTLSDTEQIISLEFDKIHVLAKQTDASFSGAVAAAQARIYKNIRTLEKRLLKAQKRKYSDTLQRVNDLQNEIFPGGGLQERQWNFSRLYLSLGPALVAQLLVAVDALGQEFTLLTYIEAPHCNKP